MANNKFSMEEAVKFGWETFMKNIGFLLLVTIVSVIPNLMDTAINMLVKEQIITLSQWADIIIRILFLFVEGILAMGSMKIALKFCDGQAPEFNDLFSCFHLFLKYFLGSILYCLIVIGGLILLIIPGLIWAIKYHYFLYLIIDKELGPIEAIKRSGQITQGVKWDLFLFGLLLVGLVILGVLACFVGILVAIPVIFIAGAYVYRKLEPIVQQPSSIYQQMPMA